MGCPAPSKPGERGEYDSESKAVMILAEFEKWLITYIAGVYHQREHSSLLTSPIVQYERGILGTDDMPGPGLARRIADEDRLRLDLLPFFERTVQPYGVALDQAHYYSDVLHRFVNAKIRAIVVRSASSHLGATRATLARFPSLTRT